MQPRPVYLRAAARILLIAAGLVAWAVVIGFAAGVRAPSGHTGVPVARVQVPGVENVLALEQAAEQAQAAADARNPRNLLFTADRAVYTEVGSYTDCSGHAALTHATAAIDTCVTGLRYFIGHNPGVFTGLMRVGVGALIGYYDATGHLHRFEIVAARTWLRKDGVPPPAQVGEAAQFQTCVTADGSVDRILDAVEA